MDHQNKSNHESLCDIISIHTSSSRNSWVYRKSVVRITFFRFFVFVVKLLRVFSSLYNQSRTTKYRVNLVTMRKYPEQCESYECRSGLNPFVLRPVKETYTDVEEVCCEGYEREGKAG